MKIRIWKSAVTAAALVLVMAVMAPFSVWAASPEFTALQKFDFDKTVAAADGPLADKLTGQYRDYTSLTEQNRSWEARTGALHYGNEDHVPVLRKRIAQIDAAKINNLKLSVEQTKKRYQPLFELYTSVNRQLAAARKLKNKTLTSILSTQAEGLKISAALARADIKGKETALTSAKKAASEAMKRVRDTLTAIDPVKTQIRAAKEALSAPRDNRSLVWKNLTLAVKKRDAKTASDRLSTINALSRQLVEQQQKMFALETRIADIIQKAEGQIPQSN